MVAYKTASETVEKITGAPIGYKAFNGGTETVLGNSESEYVKNILIQEYYAIEGGENE
jgi:hypothetical protein